MLITIAAAAMVMAAYFLLLYGGVGFIQDKRFFGSAHKDVLAVIPDKKPERFRGAHIVGGVIIAVSFLLFAGALVLSVWDGVRNGFSFWGFFGRFIAVLYVMEIYDILFFDWNSRTAYVRIQQKAAFSAFSYLHSRLRHSRMDMHAVTLK